MRRWYISIPAWGERCIEILCATVLPALESSVSVFKRHANDSEYVDDVRVIVHTDEPERVRAAATGLNIDCRSVPAGLRDFDCLSQAHREVLGMACTGDVVVLLTADLVVSGELLSYCRDALSNPQKKLVMCASIRARQEGPIVSTCNSRGLLEWAWKNKHPITEESVWPDGRASDLSRLYFEQNGNVVARFCLPHPVAVEIDGRALRFSPTIDANLMQCFYVDEIHLATERTLALVELSPVDKDFQKAAPMSERFSDFISDPLQKWCAAHRILLLGTAEKVDIDKHAFQSVDLNYNVEEVSDEGNCDRRRRRGR